MDRSSKQRQVKRAANAEIENNQKGNRKRLIPTSVRGVFALTDTKKDLFERLNI